MGYQRILTCPKFDNFYEDPDPLKYLAVYQILPKQTPYERSQSTDDGILHEISPRIFFRESWIENPSSGVKKSKYGVNRDPLK